MVKVSDPGQPLPELVLRQQATQKTLEKYRNRDFDWRAGVTCIHMLRFHLRQMGHRPEPMPRIRSAIAAKRQLEKRGCKDVSELLEKMGLERIGYASMTLGDLAVMKAPEAFGAVTICAGGNKIIGWHESQAGMAVMVPSEIEGAFRVCPRF